MSHILIITTELVLPEDDRVRTRRHAATIEAKQQGLRGMKETRKSFLSVSHQVNEEWASIFYRTTTILINPRKRPVYTLDPDASAVRSWVQVKSPRYTAGEFTKTFMCKANSRLRYVTKIKHIDYPRNYSIGSETRISIQALVTVLQAHYLQLPSLRKITLHVMNNLRPFSPLIPDPAKGEMVKSFETVGLGEWISHLEQQLVSGGSRNGIWVSTRKMEYGNAYNLFYRQYWYWKLLKLVCRREHEWHQSLL